MVHCPTLSFEFQDPKMATAAVWLVSTAICGRMLAMADHARNTKTWPKGQLQTIRGQHAANAHKWVNITGSHKLSFQRCHAIPELALSPGQSISRQDAWDICAGSPGPRLMPRIAISNLQPMPFCLTCSTSDQIPGSHSTVYGGNEAEQGHWSNIL